MNKLMNQALYVEDIFLQSEEMRTQDITLEIATEWLQEWHEEWQDVPEGLTAELLQRIWNQLAQDEREYQQDEYSGAPIFPQEEV